MSDKPTTPTTPTTPISKGPAKKEIGGGLPKKNLNVPKGDKRAGKIKSGKK